MSPSSHDPAHHRSVDPDGDTHPRQQALTGALACYYHDARHRQLRPHCQGVAVVTYGPTRLCAACNAMRSAVGRSNIARPLPGAELTRLIDAARAVVEADHELTQAARAARSGGASWSQIGDAVGLTRQAAQHRWGSRRTARHATLALPGRAITPTGKPTQRASTKPRPIHTAGSAQSNDDRPGPATPEATCRVHAPV